MGPGTEFAQRDQGGPPLPGGVLRVPHAALEKRAQPMAPAGMPQLAQRLRFDLPDALARDREVLADFLQRVLAAVFQAEAHLDDLLLTRGQRLQYLRRLLAQIEIDHRV